MAGIGGVRGGKNGVAPFQMDDNYNDLKEPGRHVHGEHDSAISTVLGLEQRNRGRTSKKEYAGKPPMTSPGDIETVRPQPSSQDAPARKSRP